MKLKAAIAAVAPDAPPGVVEGLEQAHRILAGRGTLDTELRVAHLLGQCAHESSRFRRVFENLHYTSADRIRAVFGRRVAGAALAQQLVRNPEALANHVYANRMGNGASDSGDGFRYRGRGYLQLTGRQNYHRFGGLIGMDLIGQPDLAIEPAVAWQIAIAYLATRKRQGRTAFEWADENNVELVTLIVNGGTHGLDDRRQLTARALNALRGLAVLRKLRRGAEGDDVVLLQHALAARGFPSGTIDGDFGSKTRKAVKAFQRSAGLTADGVVGEDTWAALQPLPI